MPSAQTTLSTDLVESLRQVEQANGLAIELNRRYLDLLKERNALLKAVKALRETRTTPRVAAANADWRDSALMLGRRIVDAARGTFPAARDAMLAHLDTVGDKPYVDGMQVSLGGSGDLFVAGWAFPKDAPMAETACAVFLMQGGRRVDGLADKRQRQDLVDHFTRTDIVGAGFLGQIPVGALRGPVTLVVELRDRAGKRYSKRLGSFALAD
jgi:hypothetical protein